LVFEEEVEWWWWCFWDCVSRIEGTREEERRERWVYDVVTPKEKERKELYYYILWD